MALAASPILCLAAPVLLPVLNRRIHGKVTRRVLGWTLPAAVIALALATGQSWSAGHRLAVATLGLYLALKATVVLQQPVGAFDDLPGSARLLYLTVWPGMDLRCFQMRREQADPATRRWLWQGSAAFVAGSVLLLLLAASAPALGRGPLGWAGIAAFLLTIHFGWADMLSALVRRSGYRFQRLFRDPLVSRSLTEFWGKRWNRAFVEMDRLLFVPPLRWLLGPRWAVPGVFVVSGLLHELAISFPANGGWGGPLAYFALHGGLVTAEHGLLHPGRWPTLAARCWTWMWLLVPLPWLFHNSFRHTLVVPLLRSLHEVLR